MKSNDSKVGASGVLRTLDYVKKVGIFFYIPYFTIISGCGNELFYAVMHNKFKFFPHVIYRIFGDLQKVVPIKLYSCPVFIVCPVCHQTGCPVCIGCPVCPVMF